MHVLAPESEKFLTPPSSPKMKSSKISLNSTLSQPVLEKSGKHDAVGETWDDNGYLPQLGRIPNIINTMHVHVSTLLDFGHLQYYSHYSLYSLLV